MSNITDKQKIFYLNNFKKYMDSPQSLGWNNKITQNLRFEIISRLFIYEKPGELFTIHEIGSGLAHFYEYMLERKVYSFEYSGSEIVKEFVDYCSNKYTSVNFFLRDLSSELPKERYDYLISSGTFNTILNTELDEWQSYIIKIIKNMFNLSKKGIAVNFLTSYSDNQDTSLYYSDPKKMYDFIQKDLSRFIIIDNSYPLYEYTMIIYKEDYIKTVFREAEHEKYFKTRTNNK